MAFEKASKIFRFGVFEADSATRELRKSGVRLRLQDQPFHVLLMLLERPGQLVTREELQQQLWPSDTFVDFDHSLNTIINKLREVLGDSASNPRFIETLSKRGYRFLGEVQAAANHDDSSVQAIPNAAQPIVPSSSNWPSPSSVLTRTSDLPELAPGYVRILFLLIQIMYLSFYLAALARLPQAEGAIEHLAGHSAGLVVLLILSAAIGLPVRFYFISYVAFDVKDLSRNLRRLFPGILVLDELWALAPFLLVRQIGWGLALAATAGLVYVPFAERTLALMRDRNASS
jgi:DNA-binding winged helix-turn-helix (wHTH) protein